MSTANAKTPLDPVADLLVEYLTVRCDLHWPGADGLTQDDIVDQYPAACRLGHVPDRDELCRRHTDLQGEIAGFFARRGWQLIRRATLRD